MDIAINSKDEVKGFGGILQKITKCARFTMLAKQEFNKRHALYYACYESKIVKCKALCYAC